MFSSFTKTEKLVSVFSILMVLGWWIPWPSFINIVLTAGVVLSGLFSWNSRNFSLQGNKICLAAMTLFFAWLLISVLLSSDRSAGFRALDPRLPLLYFPIGLGLFSMEKSKRDHWLLRMAYGITLVCAACLFYSVYRAYVRHDAAFLYNDAFSELTGQQSIYLSLLVNFSIYTIAAGLFRLSTFRTDPVWGSLSLLVLFVGSFLLASRTLMLVLYLSALIFLVYFIVRKKKYLEGSVLVIGLALGLFLALKFFPSTFNRFRELAYSQFRYDSNAPESHYNMEVTADQWNGANLRKALWQCGWECFLEKPVIGVSLGDKQRRLQSIYQQKNFHFALRTERNVHNNYLDILLGTGLIGLFLFLGAWIVAPAWIFLRQKDWLALLMTSTIAIAMITENYFDRSLGGMIVGFFIPFLLTASATDIIQRTK